MTTTDHDFPRGLGFETFDDLIQASETIVSPVGLWYVTHRSDDQWAAWPFPAYDDVNLFNSYKDACEFVTARSHSC